MIRGAKVSEYVDVPERANGLSLELGSGIVILPRNFRTGGLDDLSHEAEAATVRKLLKEAGLDVVQAEPQGRSLPSVIERSADWIAPTLFVSSMFLTQNPHAIQLALGVLDSYVSDVLKGQFFAPKVKIAVIVERSGSKMYRQIEYEGPPSGIRDLAEVVKVAQDDSSSESDGS